MSKNVVTLDVREDIRTGREPFSRIMQTVAALKADQQLRLLAPFEPTPLYGLLANQGFAHASSLTPEGDFEVLFSRTSANPPGDVRTQSRPLGIRIPDVVEVDARGLEPPQPLVTILEALTALSEGASLRAHTDRRPIHLFPHLEERGYTGETAEQKDGSFVTLITRR